MCRPPVWRIPRQGAGWEEYTAASPGNHVRTRTDRTVSTRAITDAWDGAAPDQFQVRWSGYVIAAAAGTYTFSTTSDDGSTVVIDGVRVVDNGGDHGAQTRSGTIVLARGPHTVRIDYHQVAGGYEMSWAWAPTTTPSRTVG